MVEVGLAVELVQWQLAHLLPRQAGVEHQPHEVLVGVERHQRELAVRGELLVVHLHDQRGHVGVERRVQPLGQQRRVAEL